MLAVEGIIIAAVDVIRDPLLAGAAAGASTDPAQLAAASAAAARRRIRAKIRVTTRAMWNDNGRLLQQLHAAADAAVGRLPGDASLAAVERVVTDAMRRTCKQAYGRRPDVVVIAHEADPRAGLAARADAARRVEGGGTEAAAAGGERDRPRRAAARERDMLFGTRSVEPEEAGSPTGVCWEADQAAECALKRGNEVPRLSILFVHMKRHCTQALACSPCFSRGWLPSTTGC